MARTRRLVGFLGVIALSASILGGCPGSNPTGPEPNGVTSLTVACTPTTSAPLRCTATVACSAGTCPPTIPPDVTSEALWTPENPDVISVPSPGQLVSAGVGDTFVRATWRGVAGQKTVSVFTGLPPQPTTEMSGAVYTAGTTPATGAIDGARVEVVGGVLAGRNVTTGTAPPLLPGFAPTQVSSGSYRLLGVPPGTYRVRVSRTGYVTQERDVVVQGGSVSANFEMVRQ